MSPVETSASGRPVARHCVELMGRAAHSEASETRFDEASADLARAIAAPLGALLGGVRLRIACSPVENVAAHVLAERTGSLAGNCLLRFDEAGTHVLASIAIGELLTLTDRVFGGEGEVVDTLPEEMPLTADLVASQVEQLLSDAFAAALAPLAQPKVAGRSPSYARLAPFAVADECHAFTLIVSEPDRPDWVITLMADATSFAALFASQPKAPVTVKRSDPLAAPFGELPLALEATLAEMMLPLARLSDLKPGDTIPLALFREVPLKISETTFAYGSIGAVDERVALQLTRMN